MNEKSMDKDNLNFIFICGAAGTGKDTFYKDLYEYSTCNGENKRIEHIEKRWNIPENFYDVLKQQVNYRRVAFADILKNIVYDKYQLHNNIDFDCRIEKDRIMKLYDKSFRSLCIEYAEYCKKHYNKPYYWAEKTLEYVYSIANNKDYVWVVTDWRFKDEFNYIKSLNHNIKTIRVYRHNIIVSDNYTEHDLDGYDVDYLLIGKS